MMRLAICFAALLALVGSPEQAPALELDQPTALSESALGTEFLDLTGNKVNLADFRGQVIVVNFWATWCGPCRREMPSIGRLQAAFEDQSLQVLAVAVDRADPEKLNNFMEEVGVDNLTIIRDPAMASMKGFALRGLPATLILNANGELVARHDGFEVWDKPEIISALKKILPEA